MAKTSMLCPFNNKLCAECSFYRGRHYYLSLCTKYRGHIDRIKKEKSNKNEGNFPDFETIEKILEPWKSSSKQLEEIDIVLHITDMESGNRRECNYQETKTWDWDNPLIIRMLEVRHITSWAILCDILKYKTNKGDKYAELYEGPRFMLLGGG
jgi:hypothetical protein